MSSNMHEGLKDYYECLSRKTRSFYCIYCGIPVVSAKEYENHCSQHHDLNSKLCCVWCCGTESWESDEKHRYADHLTACFNQFYSTIQDLTYPRPINLGPTCSEVKSFFDHSARIRQLLPPQAFQSIWPPEDLPTPPMTFQDENLNLAASYLQLYLETRHTHDWMHLMVKAIALDSFLQALDRSDGRTRLLEFWCWCDEGRGTEDMLRQHRHMIAVSPKGRFEQEIWSQVQVRPLPRPKFSCKQLKKIESPLHLVRILGCVSDQISDCSGNPTNPRSREKNFYIFKSLPTDFKLALATLWPGGVEELLYYEKFYRASISRVVERPMIRTENKWQQKIKDFYKLERGLVIPVEKRFAPTTEVTPYFIHLTLQRKLYFKPSPENETLNQASWLRMQFEGGNSFYDAVGEETWTPHPIDQRRINDIMPLVHRIEYITSDNRDLLRENAELRYENVELRSENEELRNENDELKRKLEDLKEK